MPDDNPLQPSNRSNPSGEFVPKVVETPILDSSLRRQISNPDSPQGGLKGFYSANKFYFWAILAGVIIIAVLAYFAFRKSPAASPKNADVSISVSVPSTVPSGGTAVFAITVQNNDPQKLVNLQLELTYPNGMAYQSSSPNASNLSGTLFPVPDLVSGQNAVIFVKAAVNGNINDQQTLDIKLHYHYSNFNSEFIQDQTSTITLSASNLSLQLQGPATTNNAQLVVYNVTYQNNASTTIQNGRVQMDYPSGFTFASANPPPDLGNNTWSVSQLAQDASSTIQIQGTFNSANPGQSETMEAEFLILGPDGNYATQNTSSFSTQISSLPLVVTQSLQAGNSAGTVDPGDNLTYNITYQNNASVAATGVNIEVDLDSKVVDLSSLTAQGGLINNSTIIWNASGIPQLATLLPNQTGQLSFSLKLNNPATKDSSKNLTVVSNIQIKSNEYSTAFPGNQLTLKVTSPSSINTGLTYVSGQLPPEVGKSTTYQVSISLTNSSNDFSSGILTAFIPLSSGGFTQGSVNSAESQNVQYDPTADKLTWNFGSLPADTGRFTQPRVLTFGITLNPASSDASQVLTLVKTISLTATDLFTTQPVTVTAPDITTSDVQGQNGYSDGTVQQ